MYRVYFRRINIFRTFKGLQNMAFKMVLELRLFLKVRYVFFRQHQLLLRGWCALKKLIKEFDLNVSRLAILARICSCQNHLMVFCMNWTCKMHSKVIIEYFKRQDDLSGFLLHRRNTKHSVEYRKKWLTNCQDRQNSHSNFLLHEKVC